MAGPRTTSWCGARSFSSHYGEWTTVVHWTPEDVAAVLDEVGLRELPFVAEHAESLRDFPALADHDPFDRALVAQAAAEGLMFLTADRRLLALGRQWIIGAAA